MRLKLSTLLAILIISILLSCQSDEKVNPSIEGVWQSIGSGWILKIQDSTEYAFYDITTISCSPARQAHLDEIKESLSIENDTLSFVKGVITYRFTRTRELPKLCETVISGENKKDPIYNFEVFAATVKEHYAFMELNTLDWPNLYEQQKDKLSKNPTHTGLYNVLEETLELLKDNHAFLEATDDVYEALEQVSDEEQDATSDDTLPEYGDFIVADMVAKHHLKEDMTKDSWLIKWGKMEDNIGFIQIKAMWLFADLNIPDSLIEEMGYVDAYVKTFHEINEGNYIEKEVEGVKKVMDRVMSDLINTEKIVIDIRFNGGGQDAVSFEMLSRFNPANRQIVTTKLRHENGFSPILNIYLESSPNVYTKPVFVLTSRQTGSAAEAFAIGSLNIPHLKRIGSHTQGALSTALEKTLPNGWVFSISNEIYMDNHGNSYENIGIPVDYELNYPDDRQTFFRSVANDIEKDKEHILNAIKTLEHQ